MDVLIEVYRGWEITFNTETERFTCLSDTYDWQSKEKPSYASVKKEIDDYIKINVKFKPTIIQNKYGKQLTLVGIRKDKRFMYEGIDGKKRQLESYNESDYFIYDEKNEPIFSKIEELNAKKESLRLEAIELMKQLKMEPLQTLKGKYLPE